MSLLCAIIAFIGSIGYTIVSIIGSKSNADNITITALSFIFIILFAIGVLGLLVVRYTKDNTEDDK